MVDFVAMTTNALPHMGQEDGLNVLTGCNHSGLAMMPYLSRQVGRRTPWPCLIGKSLYGQEQRSHRGDKAQLRCLHQLHRLVAMSASDQLRSSPEPALLQLLRSAPERAF